MACSGQFEVIGEPFIDFLKTSLLSAADFAAAQQDVEQLSETLLTKMSNFVTSPEYRVKVGLSNLSNLLPILYRHKQWFQHLHSQK